MTTYLLKLNRGHWTSLAGDHPTAVGLLEDLCRLEGLSPQRPGKRACCWAGHMLATGRQRSGTGVSLESRGPLRSCRRTATCRPGPGVPRSPSLRPADWFFPRPVARRVEHALRVPPQMDIVGLCPVVAAKAGHVPLAPWRAALSMPSGCLARMDIVGLCPVVAAKAGHVPWRERWWRQACGPGRLRRRQPPGSAPAAPTRRQ